MKTNHSFVKTTRWFFYPPNEEPQELPEKNCAESESLWRAQQASKMHEIRRFQTLEHLEAVRPEVVWARRAVQLGFP